MKSVLLAGTALVVTAGAAFGQGSIDLRIVEPQPVATMPLTTFGSGPIVFTDPGTTGVSVQLFVQAQISGDTDATGLTTFDGTLSDDGTGMFSAAPLLIYEATPGTPYFPGGTDFPTGQDGMFPDYRATIGANNADPGNGQLLMGNWAFLPLSITPTGAGGAGVFSNIYKFEWTTTDFSARDVTLTISATGGGYQSSSAGLVTTDQTTAGTFVVSIIPAPGAAALLGLGGLVAIRRRR